jgi:hypothetical protein
MVMRDAKPGDDVVFKHCKNGHSSDRGEREREERGGREERERGERERIEREERERGFHILATFLDIGFHHVFYVTFFTGDDREDILDV